MSMKRKIANVIPAIIIFVIGLVFVVDATQSLVTVLKWNDKVISEYNGTYSFYEKKYARNTVYNFELENGDIISVPNEEFDGNVEELENHPEMKFRYVSSSNLLNWKTHKAASITSSDGERVFLAETVSKENLKSRAVAFYVIGVPPLLLSSLAFVPLEKLMFRKRRRVKK